MADAELHARVKTMNEAKAEYVTARCAAFRALCACGLFAHRAREIALRQSEGQQLSTAMQRLLETWVPRVAFLDYDLEPCYEPSIEFNSEDGKCIGFLVWRQHGDEDAVCWSYSDDATVMAALRKLLPSWTDAEKLCDLEV